MQQATFDAESYLTKVLDKGWVVLDYDLQMVLPMPDTSDMLLQLLVVFLFDRVVWSHGYLFTLNTKSGRLTRCYLSQSVTLHLRGSQERG